MYEPVSRTPTAADVAVMVALVVGAALAVRWGGGGQVVGTPGVAALAALVCAVVLGLPALAFALERGRTSAAWMSGLGAVAGALPLLLLGLSGIAGFYFRSGNWDRASWALEVGMPIPGTGIIVWSRFLRLELQAILVGLTCGLMFWLIMVRAKPESRAINVLMALFALGTLMTAATFLR